MMVVEVKSVRSFRHASLIDDGLSVILARRLESGDFEKAIGCRIEARRSDLRRHLRIGDFKGPACDKARITEASRLCKRKEVAPVEGAAEAFAIGHRVVANVVGKPSIRVDICEVELTSRLQEVEDAL